MNQIRKFQTLTPTVSPSGVGAMYIVVNIVYMVIGLLEHDLI